MTSKSHNRDPIFIVGSPRSGTSILTWCLGYHRNILPMEESNWFAPMALALQNCYEIGSARNERSQLSAMRISRERLLRTVGSAVNGLIRNHRHAYQQGKVESAKLAPAEPTAVPSVFSLTQDNADPKQRWVDGTPEYSMDIFGLHQLFPGSRFIHIIRDVNSVVRSLMHFSNVAGFQLVNTEQEAYEYWKRTVQASVDAEHAFGSGVVTRIRYSDLIEQPELTLRRCLQFVGEEFDEACVLPLTSKINSSNVPDGFDATDPSTDMEIRREAEILSAEILADCSPAFKGSAQSMAVLEARFVEQARYLAWSGGELLRRIAAERQGLLADPTSHVSDGSGI